MEQRLGQPSATAPPLGDLVLKRSTNGGRSFEPLQVIRTNDFLRSTRDACPDVFVQKVSCGQVVYNSSAHGTGAAW